MNTLRDDFTRFEHTGWERVADKYDSVWSSLTRQFIPHLISAAQVSSGMSVLDVACGPGYVSTAVKEVGAVPTGIDFSEKMIAISKAMFPDISFLQGDAHKLPFGDASFDRVLVNFGLLHVSHPERACAEACRVLKPKGRLCFSVWAGPAKNPGARIVNDAIEAHADLDVGLPEGPPHYFSTPVTTKVRCDSYCHRKCNEAVRERQRVRFANDGTHDCRGETVAFKPFAFTDL